MQLSGTSSDKGLHAVQLSGACWNEGLQALQPSSTGRDDGLQMPCCLSPCSSSSLLHSGCCATLTVDDDGHVRVRARAPEVGGVHLDVVVGGAWGQRAGGTPHGASVRGKGRRKGSGMGSLHNTASCPLVNSSGEFIKRLGRYRCNHPTLPCSCTLCSCSHPPPAAVAAPHLPSKAALLRKPLHPLPAPHGQQAL